ncbi:MAG: DUF2953 domain-containing protein [Gammaproteobacteria bacterium]|nr:DUF2953 domain-containing protein [Gammaproteobacteria bacterium]
MLIGLVTFLLLSIALLAVPVTLTYRMSWQQGFQGDVRLRWLFGLVRIRLPASKPESPTPEGEERAQPAGRFERSSREKHPVFAIVRQKSFRRRVTRFIRDVWHAIHKRDVRLNVRIGLGDPADTGQLWAVVGPVAGILSTAREATVGIVPDFVEETFELDSRGNLRLIPLQMLYLAAGLLLSPSIWQGLKQMRAVAR